MTQGPGPGYCTLHACPAGQCAGLIHTPEVAHLMWALDNLQLVLDIAAERGIPIVARYKGDGSRPPTAKDRAPMGGMIGDQHRLVVGDKAQLTDAELRAFNEEH